MDKFRTNWEVCSFLKHLLPNPKVQAQAVPSSGLDPNTLLPLQQETTSNDNLRSHSFKFSPVIDEIYCVAALVISLLLFLF
ncbi:hypothetical protein Peur_072660 [Populus x canadensis]